MDHRVQEVMTESMEKTAGKLRELEPFMTKKMQQVIERCFSSNASSSGRFAECAIDKNKKIEEVTKAIEFKLIFFSKFANNCLMTKDVNNCKEETTRELSKMVDNIRNDIERI